MEEEEGSSYVSCGSGVTSWLQVELVAARMRLQYGEDGAVECTTITEEDSNGMDRETATSRVHFDAGAIKVVGSERLLRAMM
ncbi:hypothetical protein BHM03_00058685 [Ensete ventricosum]|nr:hypothetical protein BHM03_00058685 [Ensete ventricosum]